MNSRYEICLIKNLNGVFMISRLVTYYLSKNLIFLLFLLSITGLLYGQFKNIETSYLQFPVDGVKFEKVDVYVTLGQSEITNHSYKTQSIDSNASLKQKVINEIYDSWTLVPVYIKTDKTGIGSLRLDITCCPDENSRPLTPPSRNNKRGGYVIKYKTTGKVKVTDSSGKVLLDRNYGVLSGEFIASEYENCMRAKDGIGTYEVACLRSIIIKARAELLGRYGFGSVRTQLCLGSIPDLKDTKKEFETLLSVFNNKRSFNLSENELNTLNNYTLLIENKLNACSDRTRWIAYHNLAVCYAWLQNPQKAKDYLNKEYLDIKTSYDNVINESVFNNSDLEKYQAYSSIEEFVKYYPISALKYPQLLISLSKPLSQISDFYAYNDLLSQIYGLENIYDFFPFQKIKPAPSIIKTTITPQGQYPVYVKQLFNEDGNLFLLQVNGKSFEGLDIEAKKLMTTYLESDNYLGINVNLTALMHSYNLKQIKEPLNEETKCSVSNILNDDLDNSSEHIQLRFDLIGNMFITGKSQYNYPEPILNRIASDQSFKFFNASTSTEFSVLTSFNKAGLIDFYEWDGFVNLSWGVGSFTNKTDYIKANIKKHYQVNRLNDHDYPDSLSFNYSAKAIFKSERLNCNSLGEHFLNYNYTFSDKLPVVKVTANSFELQKSLCLPCIYQYDKKGNWISAKKGLTSITRVIKY